MGLRGSLWLDELHTAWTVSGDFSDVASRAMLGNQPPLPYWLLWPYVQVVGANEWSMRAPAFIASILSIVVVYLLVERWTKSQASGLVAATALAVQCDSFAFYASEARVYALGQLLALVHLYLFDITLRAPRWLPRIAWILTGWLLFYVHYTLALLLVAEICAWAACYIKQRQIAYRPRLLAIDTTTFALGCLPALPHLWQVASRRRNWEAFIDQPSWSAFWEDAPHEHALWWLVAGWLGIVCVRWWKRESPAWQSAEPYALALVLSWLWVPLAVAWLLAKFDIARVYYPRYLVFTLPAGGALIGLLSAMVPVRALRVVYRLAAAVVFTTWNLWLCFAVYGGLSWDRGEDWRGAVAALNARDWRQGEPLLLAAGLIEADAWHDSEDVARRAFCLFPLHAAYPLNAPQAREIPLPFHSPGKLNANNAALLRDWLKKHPTAIVVVRGNEVHARRVADDLVGSLNGEVTVGTFQGFGLVWLFEIHLR